MVVLEVEGYHIWLGTMEASQKRKNKLSLKRDGSVPVQSLCGEESENFQARMQTKEYI